MNRSLAVLGTGEAMGVPVGQLAGDQVSVGRPSVEDLYRSHYAASVRLAGLLLGDFSAGEEIAQDAFARLVDATDVVDPTAYLRATVVNLSRSRIRRAVVARRHRSPQLQDTPGPEEGTESVAVRI